MKFAGLCATVLLVAGEALGQGRPARAPKLASAAGVTPGGFLFNVVPEKSVLKLYGLDGGTRAVLELVPGEGYVLGVADSGSRVTSASAGGLRRREMPFEESRKPATARLVFRDPRGNVLATREPEVLGGSAVEIRGDEAYYVRRVGSDYVVFRTSAAELETAVVRIPSDRVRRETGRVDSVTIHASAVGVVAEFHGPYRSVYVETSRPDRFLAPDATFACGETRYDPVWPRAGGGIARISPGSAAARLEAFDADGRIVSTADLEPAPRFAVLPDGSLLAMKSGEIFVLDEKGRETSHLVLAPDEEGRSIALPGAGARALPEGATGADWAEAARKGGAPRGSEAVAARDPDGVVERFARVADDDSGVGRSREALRGFFDSQGFAFLLETRTPGRPAAPVAPAAGPRTDATGRWEAVLKSASSRAFPGGPAWFRRETARALLAAGANKAPAWALESVIEAVASAGDADGVGLLPDAAFTPELAEIVSATESARLDRLGPLPDFDVADAESPEDGGAFGDFIAAMRGRELHLPASRFPGLVLSCASHATPQRLEAVAHALAIPAGGLGWEAGPGGGDDLDEDEEGGPAPAGSRDPAAESARGAAQERQARETAAVTGLLGSALHTDDADERAIAQTLAPLYLLPIDPAAYRRDVLARPALDTSAIPLLLMDRSLGSADWTRLMADSLAAARSRAGDPVACLASPMRAMQDRYCQTLVEVFGFLMFRGDAPGGPPRFRRAEVLALARSPEAPVEIRLQGKLVRVMTGGATAAELLEVWREKDLPLYVRQGALSGSRAGAPPGLADALEHELRAERLSSEDAAALLEALRTADGAAARRIALERWEKGDVPLAGGERDDHGTSPWIASLDPGDAAASPRVHAGLRRLLEDETHGPAAAALLSKAGDPDALPWVLKAVRTGCLS